MLKSIACSKRVYREESSSMASSYASSRASGSDEEDDEEEEECSDSEQSSYGGFDAKSYAVKTRSNMSSVTSPRYIISRIRNRREADSAAADAVAAADALGKDLEAMGYNLNCTSFLTREGSSTVDMDDERYSLVRKKSTEDVETDIILSLRSTSVDLATIPTSDEDDSGIGAPLSNSFNEVQTEVSSQMGPEIPTPSVVSSERMSIKQSPETILPKIGKYKLLAEIAKSSRNRIPVSSGEDQLVLSKDTISQQIKNKSSKVSDAPSEHSSMIHGDVLDKHVNPKVDAATSGRIVSDNTSYHSETRGHDKLAKHNENEKPLGIISTQLSCPTKELKSNAGKLKSPLRAPSTVGSLWSRASRASWSNMDTDIVEIESVDDRSDVSTIESSREKPLKVLPPSVQREAVLDSRERSNNSGSNHISNFERSCSQSRNTSIGPGRLSRSPVSITERDTVSYLVKQHQESASQITSITDAKHLKVKQTSNQSLKVPVCPSITVDEKATPAVIIDGMNVVQDQTVSQVVLSANKDDDELLAREKERVARKMILLNNEENKRRARRAIRAKLTTAKLRKMAADKEETCLAYSANVPTPKSPQSVPVRQTAVLSATSESPTLVVPVNQTSEVQTDQVAEIKNPTSSGSIKTQKAEKDSTKSSRNDRDVESQPISNISTPKDQCNANPMIENKPGLKILNFMSRTGSRHPKEKKLSLSDSSLQKSAHRSFSPPVDVPFPTDQTPLGVPIVSSPFVVPNLPLLVKSYSGATLSSLRTTTKFECDTTSTLSSPFKVSGLVDIGQVITQEEISSSPCKNDQISSNTANSSSVADAMPTGTSSDLKNSKVKSKPDVKRYTKASKGHSEEVTKNKISKVAKKFARFSGFKPSKPESQDLSVCKETNQVDRRLSENKSNSKIEIIDPMLEVHLPVIDANASLRSFDLENTQRLSFVDCRSESDEGVEILETFSNEEKETSQSMVVYPSFFRHFPSMRGGRTPGPILSKIEEEDSQVEEEASLLALSKETGESQTKLTVSTESSPVTPDVAIDGDGITLYLKQKYSYETLEPTFEIVLGVSGGLDSPCLVSTRAAAVKLDDTVKNTIPGLQPMPSTVTVAMSGTTVGNSSVKQTSPASIRTTTSAFPFVPDIASGDLALSPPLDSKDDVGENAKQVTLAIPPGLVLKTTPPSIPHAPVSIKQEETSNQWSFSKLFRPQEFNQQQKSNSNQDLSSTSVSRTAMPTSDEGDQVAKATIVLSKTADDVSSKFQEKNASVFDSIDNWFFGSPPPIKRSSSKNKSESAQPAPIDMKNKLALKTRRSSCSKRTKSIASSKKSCPIVTTAISSDTEDEDIQKRSTRKLSRSSASHLTALTAAVKSATSDSSNRNHSTFIEKEISHMTRIGSLVPRELSIPSSVSHRNREQAMDYLNKELKGQEEHSSNKSPAVSLLQSQKFEPLSPMAMVSKIPSNLVLSNKDFDEGSCLTSLQSTTLASMRERKVDAGMSATPAYILGQTDADTWDEIAEASYIVEKAMKRVGRSGFTGVVTTESSIGVDVEKALFVLKKNAERLGVLEGELLLAVNSHAEETEVGEESVANHSSVAADDELKLLLSKGYTQTFSMDGSEKSLTIGEEIFAVFQTYLGPKTCEPKRQSK